MIESCVFFQLQELALKIAHLTDNAQARRRMLDHETMETHTAQVCILCFIYSFIKICLYRVNTVFDLISGLSAYVILGPKNRPN